MRLVLQRVLAASVDVDSETVAQIQQGVLVLIGVAVGDSESEADWLARKTAELRIFEDADGKMNRSLQETGGEALVVSQFTLLGDCRKGRRPAFTAAARPESADRLYRRYCDSLRAAGISVKTGIFAADMKVSLVNDGPVTLVIDRVADAKQ